MNRRSFLKNSGIALTAGSMMPSLVGAQSPQLAEEFGSKKAKNIIFMVSDGMSLGTLAMTDTFLQRKYGKGSQWLSLYKNREVMRSLMDTASASSLVTDSAAGSSSWGGGVRVNNGSLNVGPDGTPYLPILQKFKKKGKKVGCVTTVPITHATPAGFCINAASRNSQSDIADMYLKLRFDVMMGGGLDYFTADKRKDGKDMLSEFERNQFKVVRNRSALLALKTQQELIGVFDRDGLPYSIDRQQDATQSAQIPTLAEMAQKAIECMAAHPEGFVLQVESGKVDWAAHGNDIAALIHEQIAFDLAIEVVMDFARKNKDTLVIITTDHGNANPGLIYGKEANANFDRLQTFDHTNEWLLNAIHADSSSLYVQELFKKHQQIELNNDEAKQILGYYTGLEKEEAGGLYNYKKLPYKYVAELQKKHTSVGWISMDHSGDFVELAAFGPGSDKLPAFVKNTDLHTFMLDAAEIENKF
ncbi:MAG: alkaline phosphatase [Flavobacterium sp. BFFFF2]|nr:MAG: alkaline phosphatase [Flavobacterium sp. BFFFF2]